MLHHDNALSQNSLLICKYRESVNLTIVSYILHSSDLAPCDFNLFLKLKDVLKSERLQDINEIKKNTIAMFRASCFQTQSLPNVSLNGRCAAEVHNLRREYFEGDLRNTSHRINNFFLLFSYKFFSFRRSRLRYSSSKGCSLETKSLNSFHVVLF